MAKYVGYKNSVIVSIAVVDILFISLALFSIFTKTMISWYFGVIVLAKLYLEMELYIKPESQSIYFNQRTSLDKFRFGMELLAIIVVSGGTFNNWSFLEIAAIGYAWQVFLMLIAMTATASAAEMILLALNYKDPRWLAGTGGKIGLANWWSIFRMVLAVVVPYIYVAQPFNSGSNIVALFVLVFAFATDKVDGTLARVRGEVTKAGKFLDPLCDKVIFYPALLGMLLSTDLANLLPGAGDPTAIVIVLLSIFSVIFRDLVFVVWFAKKGRTLPEGIGASYWDKARFVALCVWLGALGLGLVVHGSLFGTVILWVAFVTMLLCMVISWITLAVAWYRVKDL